MLNLLKYLLFIVLSALFYSCGSEYSKVIKSEDIIRQLSFYSANQLKKEIILNENNQINEVITFNDDKLNSTWISKTITLKDSIEYYGNGKIKVKGYMKDGKKHSLWSYFDREGHLLIDRYFSYGKPSNVWIWYSHGHDDEIEKFEIYEDYRDDGKLMRYYQSGCIKDIKSYSNNKLDGRYSLFDDDCDEKYISDNVKRQISNDISHLFPEWAPPTGTLQFETNYHLGKEITR